MRWCSVWSVVCLHYCPSLCSVLCCVVLQFLISRWFLTSYQVTRTWLWRVRWHHLLVHQLPVQTQDTRSTSDTDSKVCLVWALHVINDCLVKYSACCDWQWYSCCFTWSWNIYVNRTSKRICIYQQWQLSAVPKWLDYCSDVQSVLFKVTSWKLLNVQSVVCWAF